MKRPVREHEKEESICDGLKKKGIYIKMREIYHRRKFWKKKEFI